jgi:murein DD-endopeptidase MepM/ murein hydrolase activator NlpD
MFHPTAGKGVITSGYLPPNRPDHFGIDLGVPVGTPIYAWRAGDVVIAITGCVAGNYECGGKAGNYVQILHKNNVQTQYLHLSQVLVKRGQKVKEGQLIGYSGNTGYSLGPHLHFGMLQNGKFINPTAYITGSSTKKKTQITG